MAVTKIRFCTEFGFWVLRIVLLGTVICFYSTLWIFIRALCDFWLLMCVWCFDCWNRLLEYLLWARLLRYDFALIFVVDCCCCLLFCNLLLLGW